MTICQPLVSVIIPVFNGEAFIARAIESILAQTYTAFEVVVIDDGSTDGTSDIVQSYGASVVYAHQSNLERSVARNAGLKLATGQFIAFLDADDWWFVEKLERQVAYAEKHPDLGLIYSWVNVVDDAGQQLRVLGNERPLLEAEGSDLFEWFLLGHSVPTPSVMIRKECLDAVGGFDESITYIEDWDLWMRIANRYSVGYVAEPLACYQVRHSYLPAVFARHQLQEKRLYVLEKALGARPGIKAEVRRHALQKANWYSALIDFGIQDIAAAKSRIEQIDMESPDLGGKPSQMEGDLVAFAFSLYDDFTPEAEAIAFIEFVLANLPSKVAFLKNRGRQMKSTLLGGYAFQARARGHNSQAGAIMRRAVALNLTSIFNIGVLTTCLKGIWGDNEERSFGKC